MVQAMLKRLLDVVVAGAAVILLALPFALIMLVLRFTGEGKVWFLQERVGHRGKKFHVFKFVTMREDSEWTGTREITLRNDPRVLPVGRILRKAKVNELPQFINVLKGDMSLVGWRPLMPASFAYYPDHVQERIVNLKPGLTGLGSIVFRDEEAIVAESDKPPERVYREEIAPYKAELELWYQDHQNIWLDLRILVATAWAVLLPSDTRRLEWFKDLPTEPKRVVPRGLRVEVT
jgi:lipopolysaccharide/colanic/teichoic acid biosynthesis glycosyltransferase